MEINEKNFNEIVLKSDRPVLIDFFAEWCGPCKLQAPIVDELEKEYQNTVKIYKVDVDQNSEISGQYNIMSIPTIIIFNKGQAVERLMGLQQKVILKNKLDNLIA